MGGNSKQTSYLPMKRHIFGGKGSEECEDYRVYNSDMPIKEFQGAF